MMVVRVKRKKDSPYCEESMTWFFHVSIFL